MTAPSPPTRRLEALLAKLVSRVDALEQGNRAPQLGRSSIDDGMITVRAPDGSTLQTWGVQPDGTAGTASFNKIAPPRPGSSSVTGIIGGVDAGWSGELTAAMPSDFSYVRVHVSPVDDFVVSESNRVGVLFRAGSLPVTGLEAVPHFVKLVAVNTAGTASLPSLQASATPRKVVADEVLDGIVKETSLAADAVSAAKIAANAVTSTKIADDAVTTPKIVARAIDADRIAANAVTAGKVAADAITARELKALAVTAEKVAAEAITAGKIAAGSVDATKLAAQLVLASRLIAGDPNGTRVELSSTGMIVVRADGAKTFQVDSATGNVTSMGEYYTSSTGERLAMNAGGRSSPTIRAYPSAGDRYADLRSYTSTAADSTKMGNWEFRLPLAPNLEAGIVDFMVYDSKFAPINSSRLRFRPFKNASNVVHPGWAADGQNSAVVFFGGRVYITNSANNDRAGFNCGDFSSEDSGNFAGDCSATNLRARSDVSTGGYGIIGAGLKVGAAYETVGGRITTRELTSVGNMACDGNFYLKGQINPSDARLKHRFAPLPSSPLDAFRDVDWQSWEWLPDPSTDPDEGEPTRHVMATAQDLAANPLLSTVVRPQQGPGYEDSDILGLDLTSLVGHAGAALHEAGDRIASLEAQVAALTERLDALTAA